MGFLFGKKSKVSLPIVKKTQMPNIELSVHPEIRDLIWIENGPYKNWGGNQNVISFEVMGITFKMPYGADEPSLIDLTAPIKTDAKGGVEPPTYYPSYKGFNPEQRGVYWELLKNPFAGGFDISYVFVLYYGLERHLFQGDYEKAIEVILKLRKIYDNKSFQSYSANAVVLTSLARKRPEYIKRLYEERNPNLDSAIAVDLLLLCKLGLQEKVDLNDMMIFAKAFGFTNTNYIKKYPDMFLNELSVALEGKELFVSDYVTQGDFKKLEKKSVPVYANYSIKDNWMDIPAISTNPALSSAVREILQVAHNAVKENLKDQKKAGIVITEAPKKPKKQKVFDTNKEKELKSELAKVDGYVARHYALMNLHEFYYSYRELSSDNIELAKKYAYEDISIMPMVQEEYRITQRQDRNNYLKRHSEKEDKEMLDKVYNEVFCYDVPAFKRICIILEHDGCYEEALKICNQALEFYSSVGHESNVEAFTKRKDGLLKKIK